MIKNGLGLGLGLKLSPFITTEDGGGGEVWLLAGGTWNDDGVWDDGATWEDS